MRLAYSYMRFSTPRQQWGDSKPRQLDATDKFCTRHKLTLDTTLTLHDFGMSGFRGQNLVEGGLGIFLEAIKQGRVKKGGVLIVENIDRFSRADPLDALDVFRKIIRAGVAIATTATDSIVDQVELNKNPHILMMIVGELIRAHKESERKSEFGKASWSRKRTNKARKLTARCPQWLKLSADKTTFEQIPDRVKLVQLIFDQIIIEGVTKLVKFLNKEKVPTFGRGKAWGRSSVMKIIHSRAVLGEYQPHELHFEGFKKTRKPVGPSLPNYYPAVVDEDTFYKAQNALESRLTQRGVTGKRIANLFTGLIVDGRDKRGMNLVKKGFTKLVNVGAIRGEEGTVYKSFLYDLFEKAILTDMAEITVRDLIPATEKKDTTERERLEVQLTTVTGKIARLKARIREEDDTDALADVILTLARDEKALKAQIERARQEESSTVADNLTDAQSILELMRADTTLDTRKRLKAKIRLLIDKIYVVVFDESIEDFGRKGRSKTFRFADIQVVYKTGEMRRLIAEEKTGFILSGGIKTDKTHVDLRNYGNWYEDDSHQMAKAFKLCCMAMLMERLDRKEHFMRLWGELCQLAKKSKPKAS